MILTDCAAVPPVSLDEIDLYAPERYRDGELHGAWHALRTQAPVWRQNLPDGTPFWSVTRYREVAAVLADTARFSSEHSTMLSVPHGDPAKSRAIHLTDPPRHGSLREPTLRAVSMAALRRSQDRILARIILLLDTALKAGEVDFAAVSSALPMIVTGELLGIPEDAWAEVARWTVASMAPTDPAYQAGTEQETLQQAHVFLLSLFYDLIAQRRQSPADDVVSALVQSEMDGQPLSDDDVLVNCYAFVMGASPTLPQASSQLLYRMALDPELLKVLRADPALVGTTVEEALRWASPVNHVLRRTTEPVSLCGQDIAAGALVAVWIGSANRDAEVFANPYTFDPARRPNAHLTLGFGPHRCIGLASVRLGMRLLLEVLVERVESVRLAGPPRHLESNFLNGITSLPLVLTRSR